MIGRREFVTLLRRGGSVAGCGAGAASDAGGRISQFHIA